MESLRGAYSWGRVSKKHSTQIVDLVSRITSGDLGAELNPAGRVDLANIAVELNNLSKRLAFLESDRAAAASALKASEKKYHDLFDNAPDMFASVNAETECVVECNQTLLAALGIERDQIIGKPVYDLYHPDSKPAVEAAFRSFVETGSVRGAELQLQKPSGETVDVELNVSAIRDEHGNIVASRSIWRDITQRKHDEMLRRQHTDRLQAIGQLAAGVAHEINNPAAFVLANQSVMKELLQSLSACLEELLSLPEITHNPATLEAAHRVLEHHRSEEAIRELAEMVEDNTQGLKRIAVMVKDLRLFSRVETEDVECAPLNDVIEVACHMVENEVRHRGRLIKDLESVSSIACHRYRLSQVFVNLLLNGAQALDGPDGEVRISSCQTGDQLVVVVEDNGVGMPESEHTRVFEPFFTTKGRTEGTGLGLSLSLEIVRQHGGSIEVDSEIGRGTRFTVTLPIDTGLQPNSRVSLIPSGEPAERMKLLLVDDEPQILRAYRRMLQHHHVVVAEGGACALDILREDHRFDLVLCDLMMPECDGVQVYEEISQRWPELIDRIVFYSGGAFTPRASAFVDSVGNICLEKPLESRLLLKVLDRVARAAKQSTT